MAHEIKKATNTEEEKQMGIIQEIKKQVEEEKTLCLLNPSFAHFEALFAFSNQFSPLCNTIEKIHISLDPKVFEPWEHTYIGGVLAEIISYLDGLKQLTLQHFGTMRLLAAQATLDTQQHLELVNWEHNSIADFEMSSLARTLPRKGNIKLVITNNLLEDVQRLAKRFSVMSCITSVEVFQQEGRRLDEERFRAELKKLRGPNRPLHVC